MYIKTHILLMVCVVRSGAKHCDVMQDSDQFVVGVRDDCFLHCYSLSSGVAQHV